MKRGMRTALTLLAVLTAGAAAAAKRRAPTPDPAPEPRHRARDWAELLRISAAFTVPGDALAGAAATGRRPNAGTALAVGASICLYEAGMALNDYADREVDAIERPERPIPSGRITPRAALMASATLTATGLALAAAAGRRPLATATALATVIWAYDLRLKQTPAGPAAMATARALDLLLGATATTQPGRTLQPGRRLRPEREARSGVRGGAPIFTGAWGPNSPVSGWGGLGEIPLLSAALLGAHTYAVTLVSRREAQGGSTATPLAALAATAAIATTTARKGKTATPYATPATAAATLYAATAARPYAHAALNPSPLLTQRAVGGGIRAMIPLQAALAARSDATTAAAILALAPAARRLARKVSPT